MLENSNIIDVDETNFNENVVNASEDCLVIVDFWAPWCGPCKQLTPLLEKVVKSSNGRVLLAKINIDKNQQIAGQLKIQSIPTVFAFKNKQIVDAFQGLMPEKEITKFIEKALGEKLEEDFFEFFETIRNEIQSKNYTVAKDALLDFIVNKPNNVKAISMYLSCLIDLEEFEEGSNYINSLDEVIKKDPDIISLVKRLEISKNNIKGPGLEDLLKKLNANPKDINIILEVADKFFTKKNYEKAFEILIENYPQNKSKIKIKILEFFEALGHNHKATIEYRKKFSKIMFV